MKEEYDHSVVIPLTGKRLAIKEQAKLDEIKLNSFSPEAVSKMFGYIQETSSKSGAVQRLKEK